MYVAEETIARAENTKGQRRAVTEEKIDHEPDLRHPEWGGGKKERRMRVEIIDNEYFQTPYSTTSTKALHTRRKLTVSKSA